MPMWSTFYDVEVRDEIAKDFTDETGHIDDMMAGLHEIRARMAEQGMVFGHIQQTHQGPSVKQHRVKPLSPARQKKQSHIKNEHIPA